MTRFRMQIDLADDATVSDLRRAIDALGFVPGAPKLGQASFTRISAMASCHAESSSDGQT